MSVAEKRKKRSSRRRLWVFLFIVLLLAAWVYDGNWRIEVTPYSLQYENLPAAFDGYRIALLSDLHAAEFGRDNRRLVAAISRTSPDIIAITGDFIDAPDQGAVIRTLMSQLVEIAPVYFVNGNHEWASGELSELEDILEDCGVFHLSNSYVRVEKEGESILVAGLEDPNGPYDMQKPQDFISALRAAEGEGYLLLLSHRNNRAELYGDLDVDTVLCGHGHGGLVRIPGTDGLVAPGQGLFPDYTAGVYTVSGVDMVVSRGLGFSVFARILNNPHVPLVILQCG